MQCEGMVIYILQTCGFSKCQSSASSAGLFCGSNRSWDNSSLCCASRKVKEVSVRRARLCHFSSARSRSTWPFRLLCGTCTITTRHPEFGTCGWFIVYVHVTAYKAERFTWMTSSSYREEGSQSLSVGGGGMKLGKTAETRRGLGGALVWSCPSEPCKPAPPPACSEREQCEAKVALYSLDKVNVSQIFLLSHKKRHRE